MTEVQSRDRNAAGIVRRALLAAVAAAALLAGSQASFAQAAPPDASAPASEAAMPKSIKLDRLDGSILLIGIEPQESNRIDFSAVIGLGRAYHLLDHDDALRVGVLYARGPDFVGGTLDPASWAPVLRTGRFPETRGFINPVGTIPPRREKPLVVAVQGKTQGAGHELFLAADIRVAASDTVFAQGEVTRGHFPAGGATITFVREAGWAMRCVTC